MVSTNTWREFRLTIVILIAIVSVVMTLPFIIRGNTVTVGSNPNPESSDAVTCDSDVIEYPYLNTLEGELGHKLSVRMTFVKGKLDMLWLYYNIDYEDEEKATAAFNELQASYNILLASVGLERSSAIDAKFIRNGNSVGLGVFTQNAEIDAVKPFVMIGGGDLNSKSDYIANYKNIGLVCTENVSK